MNDEKTQIFLPPLRAYEMPDSPAIALDIPPERDTFVIPGEQMTEEELQSLARPVEMPPLHPSELPDSVVSVLEVEPDSRLDEMEWGLAKRAPEFSMPKGKLLRPWDDEPAEPGPGV